MAVTREAINARRRAAYAADPATKLAKNKAWREQNPDKVAKITRRSQLKKYGLTIEQYDEMVIEWGGVCGICFDNPPRNGKEEPLVVDHCHLSGEVRGLLCWKCNAALGLLGEQNMASASRYLMRLPANPLLEWRGDEHLSPMGRAARERGGWGDVV